MTLLRCPSLHLATVWKIGSPSTNRWLSFSLAMVQESMPQEGSTDPSLDPRLMAFPQRVTCCLYSFHGSSLMLALLWILDVRCSDRSKCDNGDSSTEPYLAAHNVLRSHAKCVATYRKLKTVSGYMCFFLSFFLHGCSSKFFLVGFNREHHFWVYASRCQQTRPQMLKGQIGITLNGDWGEPISDKTEDIEAANR